MKIGITERGDASIDLSWADKLDRVDGAIVITKNITDEFIEKVLENKDKLIVHCTCTGCGGTLIEPNVPRYIDQLCQCKKLCDKGFPQEKVVIRIDPIIPHYTDAMYDVFKLAYAMGFRRYRFSLIDMYPHVKNRFKDMGLFLPYPNTQPDEYAKNYVLDFLDWARGKYGYDFQMEACAESWLAADNKSWGRCNLTGCVSEYDLCLLDIEVDDEIPRGFQRRGCLCLSCKTELLTEKNRCPHQCLYCYWRDEK